MNYSNNSGRASTDFQRIGVAGAGAWGTALALCAHLAGRDVSVWARESEIAASLARGGGNPVFLPGVDIPAFNASSDMGILSACDAVLVVVPTQHLRSVLTDMRGALRPGTPVALCAKGVEQTTLELPADILASALPETPAAVLSGPSFAADVARGLPTAVTLAAQDRNLAAAWAAAVGRPHFRIYWSDDVVGAEIGGAVKNVLAIACGVAEGLGLGRSAHAALIARGFAEMSRLGVAMGARAETLAGLSGLGDLVLTCSSPESRNMSFGMALGRGETSASILSKRTAVTEGATSASAVVALAKRQRIDMPICDVTARMVDGALHPREAMDELLSRPFREEA